MEAVQASISAGCCCRPACPGDLQAALLRYACDRMPIVHAYQERRRSISRRIGRQGKRQTAHAM
jgi:hypothetical protein